MNKWTFVYEDSFFISYNSLATNKPVVIGFLIELEFENVDFVDNLKKDHRRKD